MSTAMQNAKSRENIHTFVRNRYFYGKLLDVFHFELEQNYLNGKRWMLNRMIAGYGVLCGLDVSAAPTGRGVIVGSGAALDRCGREIIVPASSEPQAVPNRTDNTGDTNKAQVAQQDCCDNDYVHISICFRQCETDPVSISVDACGNATACSASSIQERYSLQITEGKLPEIDLVSSVTDLVLNGRLNYAALAERVTASCTELPVDCCIPLANIRLPQGSDPIQDTDIDITVRPIVYSNDMLLDILLAMAGDLPARTRGGKQ